METTKAEGRRTTGKGSEQISTKQKLNSEKKWTGGGENKRKRRREKMQKKTKRRRNREKA